MLRERSQLQSWFRVEAELDVFDARRGADRIASAHGFSRVDTGCITLVVSELGYNIVRHGRSGRISFEVFEHARHGTALRVVAQDQGAPIACLETALRDGHDGAGPIDPALLITRRGIGSGLGAIVRLSHEFRYERLEHGNSFTTVRYRKHSKRGV